MKQTEKRKANSLDIALFSGVGIIASLIILSAMTLVSRNVFANESSSADASVNVALTCQLNSTITQTAEATVDPGTYRQNIGKSTVRIICNDNGGYAIYTKGDTSTGTGSDLVGTRTGKKIETGTATSGTTSNWAMKLTAVAGPRTPTVITGYDSYHSIPDHYTKTIDYPRSTGTTISSDFETTYAVYVASNQPADTYVGQVVYTLVHPNSAPAP